jgi:outer membrane protein OmpA-like peptidoglycan-associated protein
VAGASSDGEVNHWPAFVDVLTTVIMVVTFLLVIMSAAVMVLSQRVVAQLKTSMAAELAASGKAEGAASDKSAAAAQQKSQGTQIDAEKGTSVAELGDILRTQNPVTGRDELTIRTRESPDLLKVKVKAMEQPNATTGIEVKTADTLLQIDFEPTAIRYSADNTDAIVKFVEKHANDGMKFEIWALTPQDASLSEAQRIGFYRAAVTRNLLVKAGVKPSNIATQVRVTDLRSKEGHTVRVVIKP